LKILWAPWRLKGVTERSQRCIFCDMISEDKSQDEKNLIVYRGNKIFIVMNKYPYNNGHIMLVPYRHITKFSELNNDEIIEVLDLLKKLENCYQRTMSPNGFNLGVNLGIDAGAGYEHLHFHLVPRWRGDTNFMPVIADTKVIPESLINSYRKLKSCFE
jgi:Diadenosine tetraphosphate (Ap4A) hydrolase and other HIT family hydrolases